jgi:hypothetical protein
MPPSIIVTTVTRTAPNVSVVPPARGKHARKQQDKER